MDLNPTLQTFDGRTIKLSEVSEQHLSNIVHYVHTIGMSPFYQNHHIAIEKAVHDRLNGQLLPYRPPISNKAEIEALKKRGMLMSSTEGRINIVKDGDWIGEITGQDEPSLIKLQNELKRT